MIFDIVVAIWILPCDLRFGSYFSIADFKGTEPEEDRVRTRIACAIVKVIILADLFLFWEEENGEFWIKHLEGGWLRVLFWLWF
ncbi:hypothetical protein KEJ47_09100 [Candidatus Bathyarchaeota archaeon]|nr:hypothetical protein [Candidatus Bathyarchaeota archaeon]